MTTPIRTILISVAIAATIAVGVQGGAIGKGEVRPLAFKPSDPTFSIRHGGQVGTTVVKDLAAAEQLLGKDDAKAIAAGVDFTKEQIVFVSWTTSGPPEGKLMHELKGSGEERRLIFYVQAPAANVRGQRARIGADFFVAPRSLTVTFEAKERK